MLHERIVAPKTHAVNHAPLNIFVCFIARILEDIRVVVSQRVPADASFCAALSARR
jgi:hypothetical protein